MVAWRRRVRVSGAALAALGVAASLSGCGAPRSADDAVPQRYIEEPKVSQAAQQRYGDRARQAYEEMARFQLDEWLSAELVSPNAPTPSPQQLTDIIRPRLAPTTVPEWDSAVNKALAGDVDHMNLVQVLRYYNLQAPTLKAPEDGSFITGESVTNGGVDVGAARSDGIVPLIVTFRQKGRLDLLSGRSPYPVDLRKDLSLNVIPVDELDRVAAAQRTPTSPGPTTPTAARDPRITWVIVSFEGDLLSGSDATTDGQAPSDSSPAAPTPAPNATPSSAPAQLTPGSLAPAP